MEPDRVTDERLHGILAELMRREPLFHRAEFGTSRADFEAMTAPDFWETGASGQRYCRAYVLDVLEERSQEPPVEEWETSEFHCRELAADLYLLTYTLVLNGRRTRRSTIWQQVSDGWRTVYHQGTLVQDA
ncbi:nuclear transport factor 2 family protein [Streptomyces noursei]|uniref:nuclear transport factor 2 family protein n=1 Tax=Streptomyces noursei TaxID=1971 RepID=UPI000835E863